MSRKIKTTIIVGPYRELTPLDVDARQHLMNDLTEALQSSLYFPGEVLGVEAERASSTQQGQDDSLWRYVVAVESPARIRENVRKAISAFASGYLSFHPDIKPLYHLHLNLM